MAFRAKLIRITDSAKALTEIVFQIQMSKFLYMVATAA